MAIDSNAAVKTIADGMAPHPLFLRPSRTPLSSRSAGRSTSRTGKRTRIFCREGRGRLSASARKTCHDIRPPDDTRHLLHGLLALWPSYVPYVITFMLVGNVWANHHVMFDHIRHADRMVLFLNSVLLMDIAAIPFAAAVLANSFRWVNIPT